MLEYVDQVADLFRKYIDEDDDSGFISSADVATYLSLGYNQFREKVSRYDREFYSTNQVVNVASSNQIDLVAEGLAGPAAGADRISRLLSISSPHPVTGEPMDFLVPVGGPGNQAMHGALGYYLKQRQIILTATHSGNLRIDYVPVSAVDWSRLDSGDNEWIDELVEYHDMIALMAYAQYAIRDGRESNEINKQIIFRTNDLAEYLGSGRDMNANKQMISVPDAIGYYL